MKCLDTYALIEIRNGNKNFLHYTQEEFVLCDLTLIEFYWVLLRDVDEDTAERWYQQLKPYCVSLTADLMKEAMYFRKVHKYQNLSFFDCVGYVFSLERGIPFVTGDKQFEKMKNVEFKK